MLHILDLIPSYLLISNSSVYNTTNSLSLSVCDIECLGNIELKKIWKEAVVVEYMAFTYYLPGCAE
jgi:hypothetical protein